MKKLLTMSLIATFFAVICVAIDKFIWENEFSWINLLVVFSVGAAMALLGNHDETKHRREI